MIAPEAFTRKANTTLGERIAAITPANPTVPARAVLLAGAVGFAGVIAAILSPSVVFAFLVNASGAIIAVIYLAIAVSQVRSRRAREKAGGPGPTLPTSLLPWLSYLAIPATV